MHEGVVKPSAVSSERILARSKGSSEWLNEAVPSSNIATARIVMTGSSWPSDVMPESNTLSAGVRSPAINTATIPMITVASTNELPRFPRGEYRYLIERCKGGLI